MSGTGLQAHAVVRRRGFELDAVIDAAAGETVAVMGPSGAGKSTLLDVLAGALRVQEGFVRVGETLVSSPTVHLTPQRRRVVLLGQEPHLFPHLSARDNVAFGLHCHGVRGTRARDEAEGWLARVGLAGRGAHAPRELSGGQQQRVALARALATNPDVLLLDEPLTGLDPGTAAGLRSMLATQLPIASTTAVLVTHDVVDAVALATRLVLLEEGRVSQSGLVRDVLTTPATDFGATIAGVSRVVGRVTEGWWVAGGLRLPATHQPDGDAVAYVPAGAVRAPQGADVANADVSRVWTARIVRLDATVAGVRVRTEHPLIAVDLPITELAGRGLTVGDSIQLEVDVAAVRIVGAA